VCKQRVFLSKAPHPGGLQCRFYTNRKLEDPAYYRAGHVAASIGVAAFGKGIDNVVGGMKERVFYVDSSGTPPPPCSRDVEACSHIVDRLVGIVGHCSRVSGDEFIRTRSGSKRLMYQKARDNLMKRPTTLGELAKLQFFTKTESTLWVKEQVPRIVSPRSFGFNYLLGKYLRPVEHKVFDALGELFLGLPVVAKGMTQLRKGSLIADKLRPGWVAVGLDASRFDQTIRKELLSLEHSVYEKIYTGDHLLRSLLRQQLNNKGTAWCRDGVVHASIGAMRCSGDQNTSLGNCILSCLLARLYFDEHHIDGDVLNDGDDLIMFLPETHLHQLSDLGEWYGHWGLRMKVEEPAYVPEQVEFCQSRPVWTPDGYLLVRNVHKALNTDYAGGPRVQRMEDYLVHLRSVGVCGLALAAGVPIYQSFYGMGVRCGRTGKFTSELAGIHYQARIEWGAGRSATARPIHWRTRDSFWMAFGVSPSVQESLENWYDNASFSRQDVSEERYILNSKEII